MVSWRSFLRSVSAGCAATFVALSLTACFDPASTVSDKDVMVIKPGELKALLDKSPDKVVVVDVRSPQAYAQEHITGAINIPLVQLDEGDDRLDKADTIVVYGSDYTDAQSLAAAKKLLRVGYPNVQDLRMGLSTWKSEQGEGAVESSQ